jgi:mono/diheme cytochrome c family protein
MRQLMRARWALAFACALTMWGSVAVARQAAPAQGNPEAAKIRNPVTPTPESIAAGKKTYTEFGCGTCHGAGAEGGMNPSITEDRGLPSPPALNDEEWARGGTDGEIFTTIRDGVGPEYVMGPYKDRLTENDIWNVINYIRSLAKK